MDANDAADAIREAIAEENAESAANEKFRSRVALVIAVLAALLAISSVGGDNVGEDMIASNIHASDTWAFYQAKNVRQTATSLAAATAPTVSSGKWSFRKPETDVSAKGKKYCPCLPNPTSRSA